MKRLIRKVKTFTQLKWQTKYLAFKVFCLSGIVRAVILVVPFKKLQPYLGVQNTESAEDVIMESYKIAKQIRWVVEVVSSYTPWESKCLVQAIVAQYLLKRKEITTTLYLGVCKEESGELKAHAWLRCGKMIVTGEKAKAGFKQLSKFSN